MPAVRGGPVTRDERRARVRELVAAGMTRREAAREVGCSVSTAQRYAVGLPRNLADRPTAYKNYGVPIAPLREAFLRSGLTPSIVCYRLGWECKRSYGTQADTTRLKRALGLLPESDKGRPRLRQRIGTDRAERIAEAIGVAYWELWPDE
jgi:hypothetical protein